MWQCLAVRDTIALDTKQETCLATMLSTWGKALELRERPTQRPQGTEALLDLKYCSVCHSDVLIRDGYFGLAGGNRAYLDDRGMRPPITLGHEPGGTVIAAGPDAGACPLEKIV
jgi:D-arabinose 1-dehydrogenase-like Zn-dependent alcohol dehydrogenase